MMILAGLALSAASVPAKVDAIAATSDLAGVILVARGDMVLVEKGYGTVRPDGGPKHQANARWRLASITKQAAAVMTMRMVERNELALDQPLETRFGKSLSGVTPRMLLQHRSGLANPDQTPAAAGEMPAFYRAPRADLDYCLSKAGTPNAPFSYNNCDYLLLGALFEAGEGADGEGDNDLWPGDFGESSVPGYVGGKPEPSFNIATFGTAGALTGTARDVFRFDRALMTGKLLGPAALATLWAGDPKFGYQALGQWVFPGTLKGCAGPKRIVQRDGEIGGIQTRNFILPDDDLVVIVFTNRSSDDFRFGNIWEGKGFAYDLLSTVACS